MYINKEKISIKFFDTLVENLGIEYVVKNVFESPMNKISENIMNLFNHFQLNYNISCEYDKLFVCNFALLMQMSECRIINVVKNLEKKKLNFHLFIPLLYSVAKKSESYKNFVLDFVQENFEYFEVVNTDFVFLETNKIFGYQLAKNLQHNGRAVKYKQTDLLMFASMQDAENYIKQVFKIIFQNKKTTQNIDNTIVAKLQNGFYNGNVCLKFEPNDLDWSVDLYENSTTDIILANGAKSATSIHNVSKISNIMKHDDNKILKIYERNKKEFDKNFAKFYEHGKIVSF